MVLGVYPFIEAFPRKEIFCLSSQFRRAAISIPANIAEGFAKRSSADKARFLNIAQGSVEECRYYLILSEDLGYGKPQELGKKLEDVSRLLMAYANAEPEEMFANDERIAEELEAAIAALRSGEPAPETRAGDIATTIAAGDS